MREKGRLNTDIVRKMAPKFSPSVTVWEDISSWELSPQVLVNGNISSAKKKKEEMFYLTTHSTHFIYSYLASDIW